MARHGIFPLLLLCASALSGAVAQTAVPSATLKPHEIPSSEPPREHDVRALPDPIAHAPFSLDGISSRLVEVRPASEMSDEDKLLEANAESTIREKATLQALDLSSGQWSYSQLACKGFPQHLFLRFNRNNGAGDQSAFTVSIPRYGNGRLRFIPLLRRGYSLWSPTPVNAITVSAFNHILLEERSGNDPGSDSDAKPDWVSMAVCYAALAGSGGPDAESVALVRPAMLHLSFGGGASVAFITGSHRLFQWEMIFDRNGILKKATHRAIRDEEARSIRPAGPENGRPIPAGEKLSTRAIPPTVPGPGKPIAAPPALPKQ